MRTNDVRYRQQTNAFSIQYSPLWSDIFTPKNINKPSAFSIVNLSLSTVYVTCEIQMQHEDSDLIILLHKPLTVEPL